MSLLRPLLFLLLSVFSLSSAGAEPVAFVSLSKDQKIAVYSLDEVDGSLKLTRTVDTDGRPGAMCVDPSDNHLYVALKGTASIAAYLIRPGGDLLKLGQSTIGDDASFLSVHPSGKTLMSASYSGGTVTVLGVRESGQLTSSPTQKIITDQIDSRCRSWKGWARTKAFVVSSVGPIRLRK